MCTTYPCLTCRRPTDIERAKVCNNCLRPDIHFCAICDKDLRGADVAYWRLQYLDIQDYDELYGAASRQDPTLLVPPPEQVKRLCLMGDQDPWSTTCRRHAKHDVWRRTKWFGVQYETKRVCWICEPCHIERLGPQPHPIFTSGAWKVPRQLLDTLYRSPRARVTPVQLQLL